MSLYYDEYAGFFPFFASDYDTVASASSWVHGSPALAVNPYWLMQMYWLARHATITCSLGATFDVANSDGSTTHETDSLSMFVSAAFQSNFMAKAPYLRPGTGLAALLDTGSAGTPQFVDSFMRTDHPVGGMPYSSSSSSILNWDLLFDDLLYQFSTNTWFLGVGFNLTFGCGGQIFTSEAAYDGSGMAYTASAAQIRIQVNGSDIYPAASLNLYQLSTTPYGATSATFSASGSLIVNFNDFWTP